MTDSQSFRVIILEDEEGVFCAQCLEYDICVYADSLEGVKTRFQKQVEIERALSHNTTGEYFGGIPAAPDFFHQMWDDHKEIEQANSTSFQMAA